MMVQQPKLVMFIPETALFLLLGLGAGILLLALYSHVTNPFVRLSCVKDSLRLFRLNDTLLDLQTLHPRVKKHKTLTALALLKSGWHICIFSWKKQKRTAKTKISNVISRIHRLRFDPKNPFLISGDHFSMLYPRSLGIFYYSLLDPRIPSSELDFHNRQIIYAKTVAYCLKVFSQSRQLATTIVPVAPNAVTLLNIYAYPSDTLYSILVALENLLMPEKILERYPYASQRKRSIETQKIAHKLLREYSSVLARHWFQYQNDIIDPKSGFIKKKWLLSGTKDIAKRSCAFYDMVIYWKTWQLAQNLDIVKKDAQGLEHLKCKILSTYWNTTSAQFFEDLSEQSLQRSLSSSDWLIAYQTGFLSPDSVSDRTYLLSAVKTVQRQGLDVPMALPYHRDLRPWQQYLPVRIAAPNYGANVIWSHWGIEYCKLLIHLGAVTLSYDLLERARRQLALFASAISETGGYPEVYSPNGKPYSHRLYKSVHLTGWIINFEQAVSMYAFWKKQLLPS